MERMKIRMTGLIPALCFLATAACFAADPQMGTWKLNEAKAKITPGTLKFTTIIYKSMFGKVRVEGEGIDADGKPVHRNLSSHPQALPSRIRTKSMPE